MMRVKGMIFQLCNNKIQIFLQIIILTTLKIIIGYTIIIIICQLKKRKKIYINFSKIKWKSSSNNNKKLNNSKF